MGKVEIDGHTFEVVNGRVLVDGEEWEPRNSYDALSRAREHLVSVAEAAADVADLLGCDGHEMGADFRARVFALMLQEEAYQEAQGAKAWLDAVFARC